MYQAIREATIAAARSERLRIVHVSLQRSHVHLLVEAENAELLARGMQGFAVSAAREINRALGDGEQRRRRGKVFADRYHVEVIRSPTQARHTLAYVNNWRKHGEDREGRPSTWLVDPFSSGVAFPDWLELQGQPFLWRGPATYDPLVTYQPRTWLLREGWMLAGGPISAREVPSQRR